MKIRRRESSDKVGIPVIANISESLKLLPGSSLPLYTAFQELKVTHYSYIKTKQKKMFPSFTVQIKEEKCGRYLQQTDTRFFIRRLVRVFLKKQKPNALCSLMMPGSVCE